MPGRISRCRYCLGDLRARPALDAEESAEQLAAEPVATRKAARRASRRRRLTRLLQLAALLAVAGWVGYRQFIWQPQAVLLPAPSSTAISVRAGPAVWPTANGDLRASRTTAASAHAEGAAVWSRDLDSAVAVPVVADESALYVALEDGRLLALSVDDGRLLWERELAFSLLASPSVAGRRLYVPLRHGSLQALDVRSGDLLWEVDTGNTYAASPVVADGVVYVYFDTRSGEPSGGQFVALDAEDGALLWRQDVDALWPIVPPVFDGEHIALGAGKRVVILERSTGVQQYWYQRGPARPASVTIAGGTVYGLTPRMLVAIDVDSRRPWWEGARRAWIWMYVHGVAQRPPQPPSEWRALPPRDPLPAVVMPETLVVAGKHGDLRAYSRETGDVLWKIELGPVVSPPVLTADGLLLVQDDALLLIDPVDGNELLRRSFPTGGLREAVVTSHGTYLIFEGGSLVALR
jgi:outer membrane protein assembly factor BamB